MGPLSYMRSVVDRNVVMRNMTVLQRMQAVKYDCWAQKVSMSTVGPKQAAVCNGCHLKTPSTTETRQLTAPVTDERATVRPQWDAADMASRRTLTSRSKLF